ncbi:MAG: hypothetical protein QXP53_02175 [Candidatus Pacearchaeota archaeon]
MKKWVIWIIILIIIITWAYFFFSKVNCEKLEEKIKSMLNEANY